VSEILLEILHPYDWVVRMQLSFLHLFFYFYSLTLSFFFFTIELHDIIQLAFERVHPGNATVSEILLEILHPYD
jgi:hypothetical protein